MSNIYVHGVRVCECIRDSIKSVESRFRNAGLISTDFSGLISQGCYSISVEASALTHAWGGVLDLEDWTQYRSDADVLFTGEGWIAFYRPPNSLYAGSPGHWHIVVYGCPHLHPQAQAQLVDALKGLNGLKGKGKDTGPKPYRTWQEAIGLVEASQQPIEQDESMFVISTASKSYRLVTDAGTVDLGNMGNADAVMSAINAKSTRTMGPDGWQINPAPAACLDSEADTLNAFLSLIHNSQVVHQDATIIAQDLIAAGLATAVVEEIKACLRAL